MNRDDADLLDILNAIKQIQYDRIHINTLRKSEMLEDEKAIAQKRDFLQTKLKQAIPDLIINGNQFQRLAGNLHISIPEIPNSAIIARIRHQLAISTGSACSSGTVTPSHVLRAMDLSRIINRRSLTNWYRQIHYRCRN